MSDQSEALEMIEDCENRSEKLTDWEITYIDSLGMQIAVRALTDKQLEKLEAIWGRVT